MTRPFPPNQIASVLFAVAALAPLGASLILLFSAHSDVSPDSAFRTPDTLAYAGLLAMLAVLLLGLAVMCRTHFEAARQSKALLVLGVCATLLALAIQWPVAVATAVATYYANKRAAT